jgi:hypothetical protein
MTDTKSTTPKGFASAGDILHVNVAGFTALGRVFRRGEEFTLSADDIASTLDTNGESWIDNELARPDGRVAAGPWPEGQPNWTFGSPDWAEAREIARQAAWAEGDPAERARKRAEVELQFGAAPSTSRTIAAPLSSPQERAADEQRRRMDAEGVRVKTTYSPSRRGV